MLAANWSQCQAIRTAATIKRNLITGSNEATKIFILTNAFLN
jgi:hypothetical protein